MFLPAFLQEFVAVRCFVWPLAESPCGIMFKFRKMSTREMIGEVASRDVELVVFVLQGSRRTNRNYRPYGINSTDEKKEAERAAFSSRIVLGELLTEV